MNKKKRILKAITLGCLFLAPFAHSRNVHVSPTGAPQGDGSKDKPIDARTAFAGNKVEPGDTVWFATGTYGRHALGKSGTKGKPIIYRAMPGQRATLRGLTIAASDVWIWGFEVTVPETSRPKRHQLKEWQKSGRGGGDAIHLRRPAHRVKIINCHIHNHPGTGIGGWDVGENHEYYGNIIGQMGQPTPQRGKYHGFYTQNTKKHGLKRIGGCIIFEGYGLGIQAYGYSPNIYGYRIDNTISFCNGAMSDISSTQMNILCGGQLKPVSNVILRHNATYHPPKPVGRNDRFGDWVKRSVDVGFVMKGNKDVIIEENYLSGGNPTIHVVHFEKVTFTNNKVYSPGGTVHLLQEKGFDYKGYVWDKNEYWEGTTKNPFSFAVDPNVWTNEEGKGRYTRHSWKTWRSTFGFDQNSTFVPDPPSESWIYKTINEFEPERIHLAVYNWPHAEAVKLDLSDLLEKGQKYRLVDIHDLYGKPVLEGAYSGPISLKLTGEWAPEFACYVLFRDITEAQTREAAEIRKQNLQKNGM